MSSHEKSSGRTVESIYRVVAEGSLSGWKKGLKRESRKRTDFRSKGRQSHKEDIFLGFPKQRWILIFGDLFLIALSHYLSSWIRMGYLIDNVSVYTRAFVLTLLVYPITLYIFDLYNISRSFWSLEIAYRGAIAITLGGVSLIFIFYLIPFGQYGRGIMGIQMAIIWILLNGWRLLYGMIFSPNITKIPAIILGAGHSGRAVYELLNSPFSPYEIKGFVDDDAAKQRMSLSAAVLGKCDKLAEIAKQVGATTAIMAIPRNRSTSLIHSILDARLQGLEVKDSPDVFEQLAGRIPVQHIADHWLLFADGFYLLHKDYMRKIKRLADLVMSTIVLFLTGPLIGLAALTIRLESSGPVLYAQDRVGKGHKTFTMYKFRSMRCDAETSGPKWAEEDDPRITRVGKWLRLTHIDEIPQIWNVFKGDMSFVGPRPERPEFVRMLEEEVPYYSVRHILQPGLSGWAQINYQYGNSVDDALRKLEYDLYYVKNMSILLDLKIILKTIGVVILRDGAR